MSVSIANLAQTDLVVPLPEETIAQEYDAEKLDEKKDPVAVDIDYSVHVIAADGHKPTLTEYMHYAAIKREAEKQGISGNGVTEDGQLIKPPSIIDMLKGRRRGHLSEKDHIDVSQFYQVHAAETIGLSELEKEKVNARRALRVAHWSAIFYLITTDILGPFNAPFAIANLGMVPGVLLYFFFGVIASATGLVIWYLFCKLDSDRYPIRTYGDIAERVAGRYARYLCTFLQQVQLVMNVGLICLSSGQSLYQVSHNKICLSVAVVVWAIIGMLASQIRSLRNISFIGSASVYMNLMIIFISMGVVAHSPPNYAVANAANNTVGFGPVVVKAFNTGALENQIVGMFNMIFAYGGAMIFPEMMAEMRRPFDFWKGMAIAEILIGTVYLLYGVFWYSFQGQYTQANSFQGLSPFAWQTVCNVLNMITGAIAGLLYGNVGIKIAYINIVEGLLKGPPLNSKKGRVIWTFMAPSYWALSYVIGSAIPALGSMTGLIGAMCIFQFSYTFPPILWLIYQMRTDAGKADRPFEGFGTKEVRFDTWKNSSRWSRAIGGRFMWLKLFAFGIFLASLACAGLGLWGNGEGVKQAFLVGQGTSFGCSANA